MSVEISSIGGQEIFLTYANILLFERNRSRDFSYARNKLVNYHHTLQLYEKFKQWFLALFRLVLQIHFFRQII
jgi:hypothetical protein